MSHYDFCDIRGDIPLWDVDGLQHVSGVYCIKHHPSGKVYIGQSQNIAQRMTYHRTALQRGRFNGRGGHHNTALQLAWNASSGNGWGFSVVVFVADASILLDVESSVLFACRSYKIALFNYEIGYDPGNYIIGNVSPPIPRFTYPLVTKEELVQCYGESSEIENVFNFLQDRCITGSSLSIAGYTLYRAYKAWPYNECRDVFSFRHFIIKLGVVMETRENAMQFYLGIELPENVWLHWDYDEFWNSPARFHGTWQ